jgi:transcription elongation factor Elf1
MNQEMEEKKSNPVSRAPALDFQMRCPSCRKLYSVDAGQVKRAGLVLKFVCLDCHTRFAALVQNASGAELETYVDSLEKVARIEQAEGPALRGVTEPVPLHTPVPTAVRSRSTGYAPTPMVRTRNCPKCNAGNTLTATECQRCGIVFRRFVPGASERVLQEIELTGRSDLLRMWDDVMADYFNEGLHERFIDSCYQAGCLTFAAQKYTRLCEAAPAEDLAQRMRKRVIGFASIKTDATSRIEGLIITSRAIGFNGLLIFLGTIIAIVGAGFPKIHNLAGVGLSMIALAVGMRVYLRRPQ